MLRLGGADGAGLLELALLFLVELALKGVDGGGRPGRGSATVGLEVREWSGRSGVSWGNGRGLIAGREAGWCRGR